MPRRPRRENLNQVSPPRRTTPSTAKVSFLRRSGAKGASRVERGHFSATNAARGFAAGAPKKLPFCQTQRNPMWRRKVFRLAAHRATEHVSGYRVIGRRRSVLQLKLKRFSLPPGAAHSLSSLRENGGRISPGTIPALHLFVGTKRNGGANFRRELSRISSGTIPVSRLCRDKRNAAHTH